MNFKYSIETQQPETAEQNESNTFVIAANTDERGAGSGVSDEISGTVSPAVSEPPAILANNVEKNQFEI
jgi:hypothetical protein